MSALITLENKSKIITQDENWKCYVWAANNLKLRGITKRLKKRFYPYVKKNRVVAKRGSKHGEQKLVKGIRGGKLVHGQVELFVEYAKQGKLEEFKRKNKPDPRLIKIVNEIVSKKYQILYSEYKVGDKDLRLGTGVDILAQEEDGGLVLIEIKTGYLNGYTGPSTQRMKEPFNALDTCPWSQHQLQLLATRELFTMMTGLTVKNSYIWVVNSKPRPDIYPLHPELSHRGQELLVLLAASTDKSKKRMFISQDPKSGKRSRRA